jgi:hypothetical protein
LRQNRFKYSAHCTLQELLLRQYAQIYAPEIPPCRPREPAQLGQGERTASRGPN